MKPGRSTDYIKLRKRLKIAREIISEGGNCADFAKAIGVTPPAVTVYLRKYAPEHLEALKDGHRRNVLHPLRVLHRLRVLKKHRTKIAAARELGVSSNCLHMFIARYCEDGIDATLADYEEAYGAPLLEAANGRAAA